MGDLHFLLVILAAVVSVKAIDLCPFDGDWKYHDGTGTCLSLNQTSQNYISARDICRNISGGPSSNNKGHLVIILDEDTDDVVKEMLNTDSVDKALIGLSYNTISRRFSWNETTQGFESYQGWARNRRLANGNTNSVVITAHGWKTADAYDKTSFVCQVDAAVELPRISCPLVAEVGQPLSNITCTMNIPTDQTVLSQLRFTSAEEVVGSCNNIFCLDGYKGYKASLVAYTQSWSSTLQIHSVKRKDESDWRCSVRFNDRQEITSRPCYLHVYALPATIACKVNYFQDKVNVSCTAAQMYPKGACYWEIEPNSSQESAKNDSQVSIPDYDTKRVEHYRQVCSLSAREFTAGTYVFQVLVYPIIMHQGKTQRTAYKTGNLSITLELPVDLPVMYDSNDRPITSPLSVRENQTVTIKCKITGGTPLVYATVIMCSSQPQRELLGNVISIDIAITPAFLKKNCSCYGKHVTGFTRSATVMFLVISPPKITSFTIDRKQSYEIWNYTEIAMTCKATGYPMPKLSILYNHGDKKKLKSQSVDTSEITHTKRATCQSMGEYICLAENDDQQKDNKSVNLRVRCAPEYCPGTEKLSKFGASVGSNKTVKLCVIAHPAPTYFSLSKDSLNAVVASHEYRVSFTYIDKTSGRGEITVTILSVDQHDFGSYQLFSQFKKAGYSSLSSYLKFELLAPVAPSCPENLTVSATFSDSITLSWKPGFDGGLQQSFTILRYDSGSTVESQPIPQPAGSLEDEMSYNVTGLSGSTTYTFGLRAENENGVVNCELQAHGLTKASPLSSGDQNLIVIVVPVVLVLVLVIIVVVVVIVVVRRRRSTGVFKQDTAQAPKAHARSSSTPDDHETSNANAKLERRPAAQGIPKINNFSKGATEEVGQDNAYAQVVKDNTKKAQGESRDKNISKRNSDELKQDNTYALVNKQDKGKGKKQKRIEGGENNGAVMYANTSDYVTMNPRPAVADEVYANVAGSSKAREEKPGPARDDGRTVTEDGLIYAEVMTNAKLTSPEIKGQARPKVTKLPPKVEEPGVQYMELDLVATARHK